MKNEEKLVVFGGPKLYREWGYRFTNQARYASAISAFKKSVEEAETEDIRTLIGWSRALSKFTRYPDAAQMADKCMEIDPQNYRVKWRRVETLFQIAEFDYSLVHAHQGMTHKRYPFEWGVFQGNETAEDCVGRNTSARLLMELYPWIKNVQEQRKILIAKLDEEEDEFEGIDDEHSRFKVNDPNTKLELFLRKLHRVMAKTYLGHGAKDRYFLENVLENPNVWSANTKGSQDLYNLADSSYTRTCYRQEVLRIRKPFYVFRFLRNARSPGHKEQMAHERQLRRYNIVIEADFILMEAHRARMSQDYPLFFNYVSRAKDVFESYSDNMFPLKQRCLNAIYKMASWAYLDTRNLTCFKDESIKLLYLKHHLGIRVAKLPRDCELGWVPTLNRKTALKTFRKRLALASEPLELSWLFHELAKLLTETRRYDLARFYAKKARDVSNEAEIHQWTVNANHVLIRIELDQNNRNEAREAAQLALLNSKRLGIDYLVDFYKRSIKLVDDLDFEKITGLDSIETREQLILDLMPSELYTNVDFLLRSMNVVPARRRLTVMPGCKPINHKYKLSCKRNTILPDPPKNPEKEARAAVLKQYAPSKKILGWVNFEEYE
ncbi:tetratricopeptide repeat protein 25 [Cephus cinctus]|uniref:Tetratricopeptide repeat protein 25 n=1 Tax=Cephus cinctus TaxID=211228 RepID=A0AAJ7VYA7_CEPCN|nr:tetratricopeptide repeat protein 25 [Cephus cinctus]XP_024937669.1 tetratricopeptide repeat protein 25 [Cephus cinctus]